MKVSVNAKEFKKVIEGALAVAAKGTQKIFDRVEFNWSDAVHLRVLATNIEEYFDYTFNDRVTCSSESTIRSIQIDDKTVKKLCNFSGDILYIDIDEEGNTFTIGNNKRKMSTIFYSQENNVTFEVEADPANFTSVLTMEYDSFVETIKRLSMFRSDLDCKPILKGFYFDCSNKRISACDGYKAAMRKLDKYEIANVNSFTTSGMLAEAVKKLFIKGESVEILVNKKYAKFISGNLIYHCRLIDGEYLNLNQNIPKDITCDFEVEANEILDICKDYKKLININDPMPCTMYNNDDGRFYMGIRCIDIKSCTEISIARTTRVPMRAGYSIRHMESCFGVFKGNSVLCKYKSQLYPLVLENDEYISLLLPVRVNEIEDAIKSYNSLIA